MQEGSHDSAYDPQSSQLRESQMETDGREGSYLLTYEATNSTR